MEGLAVNDLAVLHGKRAFVTGHTGFKGAWLSLVLRQIGMRITGYSLPPPTTPSLFDVAQTRDLRDCHIEGDVRDVEKLAAALKAADADVVFHLAAQSLVRASLRDPLETFSTNVLGTAAVLQAVRRAARPCAVVVVTSDKCYEPHPDGRPHREDARLGGNDPYSASKGAAELVTASFRHSYFPPESLHHHGVQVATARAGNVIGGGDWAEDRIVTDIVSSVAAGRPVRLRNPEAIRPWQHVLDPIHGYAALAAAMMRDPAPKWCTGWNFGPSEGPDITVRELTEAFLAAWGEGRWETISDAQATLETPQLRLDVTRAATLPWRTRFSGLEAIRRTAAWYRGFHDEPAAARRLCADDLAAFEWIQPLS